MPVPLPYRVISATAGALIAPLGGRIGARSGRGGALPQRGVWLHGASVGEVASARVVIAALADRWPMVVTANTRTGVAAAEAMGVTACLAPMDTPQALRRFIARAAPRLAITVENELWPNRAAMLAAAGVPQMVIGARLSARSAARWGRLPGLIRPILGTLAAVSAQDAASEARLVALGLPRGRLLGRVNLKLLGPARDPVPSPGPMRALTILAASTHAGEDEALIAALPLLRRACPGVRLILAPRHPKRFAAVAGLLAAAGIAHVRRSQGGDPGGGADGAPPVLLADSMGEMARWYAAAGICLTGGSLVPAGGHTPWEPAAQGCAILHGPQVANFAGDYALLDAAGGAMGVTATTLAGTLAGLLADPGRQRRMGAAARDVLMTAAGDPARLIAEAETLLGIYGLSGGACGPMMPPTELHPGEGR